MSSTHHQLVADRYRLIDPLGQGGMGRVWKARDEVLHRDVAIKELVPPPGLTDDERQEMRERSLREARAIARLNHVNVVRVFDILRTDADPWIVMEYVPSRSLQDVLAAEGPLPPVRVAEIGLGVLGALQAAHRAGVVHRDVKPGNVLLGFPPEGAADQPGRVVLTDFGLATVPGDPNVTRTGLVLGSPAYIAPERARDGSIAPAGDLWSLGATLYAAVEGQSPYARPSAMATLAALATEPPPPPRRAGPLKPVVTGLLRKDPANRITAAEAERLLRRALGRSRGRAVFDVRRVGLPGAREPRTRVLSPSPPAVTPADGPALAAATVPAQAAPTVPAAATVPAPVAPTVPTQPRTPPHVPVPPPSAGAATGRTSADGVGAAAPGRTGLAGGVRWWLVGVLAALVLLTLIVVVPLAIDGPEGGGTAQPTVGPTRSTATAAPPPSPTTIPPTSGARVSSGPPALPPGWRLHRDPTGFSVPVPEGWRVSREKWGSAPDEVRVYFKDPRGGRLLLIDQTNSPKPDPVADWTRQEAARRGGYPGYRRVKIEKVDYWDKAADWEWTYNLDGTRVHVRNRGFITAADKAYGMFWRTPESVWEDNLDEFEVIAAGFRPARS